VLVLAVPAALSAASEEIATGVADVASSLCPGALIQAGYADGGRASLAAVLGSIVAARPGGPEAAPWDGGGPAGAEPDELSPYAAVVVPLAITPDPGRDAWIRQTVAQAGPSVVSTDQLGPHPLLAGALHDRLTATGRVGQRRIAGLSLVKLEVGVLVVTTGGEDARQAAETAAVLLTARLGVPVAAVCLDSKPSLDNGVAALRGAGASHLVMAPYLIGPEVGPDELAGAAAAVGADCAPAIGAHPAIGQLVTMRYGAALLGQHPPGPARFGPLGRTGQDGTGGWFGKPTPAAQPSPVSNRLL
jgi:sirohydrochlorin ferrochelatase